MNDNEYLIRAVSDSIQKQTQKYNQKNMINKPLARTHLFCFFLFVIAINLVCLGTTSLDFMIFYSLLAASIASRAAYNPIVNLSTNFSVIALYHPINLFLVTVPIALYALKSGNFKGVGLLAVLALLIYVKKNVKKSSLVSSGLLNSSLSIRNFLSIKGRK